MSDWAKGFKKAKWLIKDLAYSIRERRHKTIGIMFVWKKAKRCKKQGYQYIYYDGPWSFFWLGPLHIWWMGDSFGNDYRKEFL